MVSIYFGDERKGRASCWASVQGSLKDREWGDEAMPSEGDFARMLRHADSRGKFICTFWSLWNKRDTCHNFSSNNFFKYFLNCALFSVINNGSMFSFNSQKYILFPTFDKGFFKKISRLSPLLLPNNIISCLQPYLRTSQVPELLFSVRIFTLLRLFCIQNSGFLNYGNQPKPDVPWTD